MKKQLLAIFALSALATSGFSFVQHFTDSANASDDSGIFVHYLVPREVRLVADDIWLTKEQVVEGWCDSDCTDVDLHLEYWDGSPAQNDSAPNDTPRITVLETGYYDIKIEMYTCEAIYCDAWYKY